MIPIPPPLPEDIVISPDEPLEKPKSDEEILEEINR